ncbi:MAG TPA: DUF4129 domain-containing protein [Nocardioides sp.]|jgi:hypothetical protein|nr:DUF4129 domain-containing protein [Nocardioides sp.]
MTARRAGASAVALTVLAVGVMLVMVMFAARSGPERIFTGPLHDPSIRPVTPSLSVPPRPGGSGIPRRGDIHSSPFLEAVGTMIKVLALVCLLWLLYRGGRALVGYLADRKPRTKPQRPGYVDFDVLDDPEPLVEEMREDADLQFELLLGGHPRNAIVACWDRFEEQAERVKAARKPWETSSEFTLRLLDAVSADSAAVSRLEALYREARFSEHEITEDHRRAAVEALRAIHASLGIGVGAR